MILRIYEVLLDITEITKPNKTQKVHVFHENVFHVQQQKPISLQQAFTTAIASSIPTNTPKIHFHQTIPVTFVPTNNQFNFSSIFTSDQHILDSALQIIENSINEGISKSLTGS